MARRKNRVFNKNRPQVRVRESRGPARRNPYARVPEILELAALACGAEEIFRPLCNEVSTSFLPDVRHRLPSLSTRFAAIGKHAPELAPCMQEAQKCCKAILDHLPADLPPSAQGKREPSGQIASAISEAVAARALLHQTKREEDCILDAEVFQDGGRLTKCNIDLFWSDGARAEAYECKNDPCQFFMWYGRTQDRAGRRRYERSQLFLMLSLKALLEQKSIRTHLGVVTLKKARVVNYKLNEMGSPRPPAVEIYARSAIFDRLFSRSS